MCFIYGAPHLLNKLQAQVSESMQTVKHINYVSKFLCIVSLRIQFIYFHVRFFFLFRIVDCPRVFIKLAINSVCCKTQGTRSAGVKSTTINFLIILT